MDLFKNSLYKELMFNFLKKLLLRNNKVISNKNQTNFKLLFNKKDNK